MEPISWESISWVDYKSDFALLFFLLSAPFIGSFLGFCFFRCPTNRPILFTRSRCLSCGHVLQLRDLIPVFSWLWLRGHCRYCKKKLSRTYPVFEISALVITLWVWAVHGSDRLLWGSFLGWSLLLLAAIDIRYFVLPNPLTFGLMALGLAWAFMTNTPTLIDALLGLAVGYLFFALVASSYQRCTGRSGLGEGDAKLLAACGAWTGWQGLSSVVAIAALLTLLIAISYARFRSVSLSRRSKIVFGPGLAIGLWLVWLYGPINQWSSVDYILSTIID